MDDLKQIIPAPDNLYVIYKDGEEEFEVKVLCLGLTNSGDVVMIDSDDNGHIDICSGFDRILYKK